jgi:putative endonuclease
MFTTYILFSNSTQKFYTGHCEDFSVRLEQHNSGRNKSTKSGGPWVIAFSKQFNTRAEAMSLEIKIKKRGAKRFLEDLRNSIG